jgi:hypothetical protein
MKKIKYKIGMRDLCIKNYKVSNNFTFEKNKYYTITNIFYPSFQVQINNIWWFWMDHEQIDYPINYTFNDHFTIKICPY